MRQRLTNYIFNPAAKTITFSGQLGLTLDGFQIITNLTSNVIIYDFGDATLGGSLSGNVLTLTFNTASMGIGDALQIFYYNGNGITRDPSTIVLEQMLTVQQQTLRALVTLLNITDNGSNYTVNDFTD